MFHPTYTYINKTVKNFEAVPLLVPIFEEGKQVYFSPSLQEIQTHASQVFDQLWDEYKRVLNPQEYPVDLAQDVWEHKMELIDTIRKQVAR
ncbi:Nicotinate phosphoribosyltransferase [Streptococcus sp. DD13]|nr:Nicotinate phosphoribosyltransferase [Streptococcus sp. DD13]